MFQNTFGLTGFLETQQFVEPENVGPLGARGGAEVVHDEVSWPIY